MGRRWDIVKIGVLAIQGAVLEHRHMIERVGAESLAVRKPAQLDEVQGLIIPGGESTTISKLMYNYGFVEPVRQFAAQGKAIFGTCAGLILLASQIEGSDRYHLGLMDMVVSRNAFGRQRESFEVDLNIRHVGDGYRAVFIRAPYIVSIGGTVEVLAEADGKIVAARQGRCLAAAFHPELTDDTRMHAYFMQMVRENETLQAV